MDQRTVAVGIQINISAVSDILFWLESVENTVDEVVEVQFPWFSSNVPWECDMLKITLVNDGTGSQSSANYVATVYINNTIIYRTHIKGHDRSLGWRSLISQLICGQDEESQLTTQGVERRFCSAGYEMMKKEDGTFFCTKWDCACHAE